MSHLFKRSKATGAPWYASFTEVLPGGQKRKKTVSTKTPDHATAKKILAKLESDAAVRHFGIVDPLADQIAKQSKRTVDSHLTDFRNKMAAKGCTEKYINRTANYIAEYATFAGCACVGDFSADTANKWGASLKNDGLAARTIAARLTAIKSFSRWLTNDSKLVRDPFASVSKPNPQSDRRRERRMLLPTEWPWLMRATEVGGNVEDMPACERQLLYRLAVQTGLRSSELRSLGRGHFHLEKETPFVRVVSGETKNRKVANQYIDAELARDLKRHLASKMPGADAFASPDEWSMASMLRADLEAARRLWIRSTDDPQERARA